MRNVQRNGKIKTKDAVRRRDIFEARQCVGYGVPVAFALIRGVGDYADVKGELKLFGVHGGTLVVVYVEGLPDNGKGFFGFHIHEGSSCTGDAQDLLKDTGGHYNPFKKEHPMHAGDLPSLLSNEGSAWMSVYTRRFYPEEVVGRTIVIHDMPDDFRTQPSGDSGMKIACGVIRTMDVV